MHAHSHCFICPVHREVVAGTAELRFQFASGRCECEEKVYERKQKIDPVELNARDIVAGYAVSESYLKQLLSAR